MNHGKQKEQFVQTSTQKELVHQNEPQQIQRAVCSNRYTETSPSLHQNEPQVDRAVYSKDTV